MLVIRFETQCIWHFLGHLVSLSWCLVNGLQTF